MSQAMLIEKWYNMRQASGKLNERQLTKLKELKDKAIADGSTAFEYEQKVRQMLMAVR